MDSDFDKFDDEAFFDKFTKKEKSDLDKFTKKEKSDLEAKFSGDDDADGDSDSGSDSDSDSDSDSEEFAESPDRKDSDKPEFVPDKFENAPQSEITEFYDDKLEDIAHILDPDLPGPQDDGVDMYDLIDEMRKVEFAPSDPSEKKKGDPDLEDGLGIVEESLFLDPGMLRIRSNDPEDRQPWRRPVRYRRSKEDENLVDSVAQYFVATKQFEPRKKNDPEKKTKEAALMDDIFDGATDETRQRAEAMLKEVYGDRLLQFAGPMRTPVVEHDLPEGHWGIDFIENCRLEMMNNPYYPPEEVERSLKIYAHRISHVQTIDEMEAEAALAPVEEEEEEDLLDDEDEEIWDAWADEEDTDQEDEPAHEAAKF